MSTKTITHNNRLAARVVGILFIIGTTAGILSAILTGSVINGSDYLTKIPLYETQVLLGSILVLVMGFSLAMVPVILFPILKRYNEALALGAVVFRGVLETVLYIAIATGWLLLIGLSNNYTGANPSDAGSIRAIGDLIQMLESWSVHILAIVFSLGALMIYWLFYISRLIPRWLAVWGLVGGVMYLAVPLFALFNLNQFDALMAPLALQEMVLALWLIFKGFNEQTQVATKPA